MRQRPPLRLARFAVAAAVVAAGVGSNGCGRRATLADCRMIVDKSVELQMKRLSLGDPAAIRKREDEVRRQLQADISSCEGRRVSEGTLACVQRAKTSQELEQCLR